MKPPTELHGIRTEPVNDLMGGTPTFTRSIEPGEILNDNSWVDQLAFTGSGMLEFLSLTIFATQFLPGIDVRLLIDNNEVWLHFDFWPVGDAAIVGSGVVVVGGMEQSVGVSLGQMAFNTSFALQCRTSTTGQEMEVHYRYQDSS